MTNITFLGTGTSNGVPVLTCKCRVCRSVDFRDKRLRSSVLIEADNTNIVIDSGPDFRQQMLRSDVPSIQGVIFTHEHKDHTAGLDDVRPYNYLSGKKVVIPIYARASVLQQIKTEYNYIFDNSNYPGLPLITPHSIDTEFFTVGDVVVQAIEVMHHKLPVFGFRFGDFTYITDANFISEESKEKIRGSRVLVLNALQIAKHISHFNLQEAINMATELGVEKTYFTHLSHNLGLHREIEAILPENIRLAYDGLTVSI